MEKKYKELLDYSLILNIKKIGVYGNIDKSIFDNTYFEIIEIKNINNYFQIIDYDLLVLPINLKYKFIDKKVYCLFYDEKCGINYGILNKEILINFSYYKEKYYLNNNFFYIIKGLEIGKIIFGNIYICRLEVERFKISISNGMNIYLDVIDNKDNCYYNFGKFQLLANFEKIITKKDKIESNLLLKIIIKIINNNLNRIN